jgi:hypothetical protein
MRSRAIGSAIRKSAVSIALVTLAACTTTIPLSTDYRGPDAWPADSPNVYEDVQTTPFEIAEDVEARTRAHFVVRQLSLPSSTDPSGSIDFEYYDVDGDARTPVVVLLPIFNGQLKIPRYFARYFANQGWAAVVVTRGRDPLEALTEPESTLRDNLQDYHRVLDWIDQSLLAVHTNGKIAELRAMGIRSADALVLIAEGSTKVARCWLEEAERRMGIPQGAIKLLTHCIALDPVYQELKKSRRP